MTAGDIIVKNCTDATKFNLINSGFYLVESEGNLVITDQEPTGINTLSQDLFQGEGVNLQGIKVGKNYKGIVVNRGKKYIVR